jgi:hypothetical protein
VLPPTDCISLYRADVGELLASLPQWGLPVDFVHLDPPWQYRNFSDAMNGAAAGHYDGLPLEVVAEHMAATYDLAVADAYLACWVTFPKLVEWVISGAIFQLRQGGLGELGEISAASLMQLVFRHLAAYKIGGWEYITGGAWGKTNGLGIGFHMRGDSELLLLYKKGSPQPKATVSNFWPTPRIGHSEKPQRALRALISMATQPDGVVLDLYAGASASCARACRALGRRYIGAEIDPTRHAQALRRLSLEDQAEMWDTSGNEVESDIELVS